MMKSFIFLFVIIFSLVSDLKAQTLPKKFTQKPNIPADQKEHYESAEFHLEHQDYSQALAFFKALHEQYPENIVYKYRLAICYLYNNEYVDVALQMLKEIMKEDKSQQHLYYFLARAFTRNYKFDEAIVAYNRYLLEGQDSQTSNEIRRLIEQCEAAKIAVEDPKAVAISNLSAPINSEYSEYVPVISSDESVLMLTYRGPRSKGGLMDEKFNKDEVFGEYYEDIFVSYKLGNNWLEPEPLSDNINSLGHDACIALSADGQKLFIYKSTIKDNGDIYLSTLDGEVWSTPVNMGPEINSKDWDGSISISGDETVVYFASERPGGYGGRDIWKSVKLPDGTWGKAVNLGPTINTKYDEDAPFIHPDSKTLYFSSEGHNSIGGYDIFKTTINEDGIIEKPENIGFPINTPGDDLYFVVSASGERGYYSSGKAGGMGQQDIYVMDLNQLGDKPILAMVHGIVYAKGKPVKATIQVENMDNGKNSGPFSSNSSTGKYILTMPPGSKYRITYEVPNYKPRYEYVDVKALQTFVEVVKDLDFAIDIHMDKDTTETIQSKIEAKIKEIQTGKTPADNKVPMLVITNEGAKKDSMVISEKEKLITEQKKETIKTETTQTQTAQATQKEGVKTEQQKETTKTEAAQTQTAQATQKEGVKTEQQKETTKTEAAQTQTAQATQKEGVQTEQQKEATKSEAAQTQTAQATQQEVVKTEHQKEAAKTETAQTQTAQATQKAGVQTEQQKETTKSEVAQTQTAQATQQEGVKTEQQKEATKTEAAQTQTAQATQKEGVKTEQQKETAKTEAAQTQTAQATQQEGVKTEQQKETAKTEAAQTQTAQAAQQEGVKTEQQKEATKSEAAQTQTAQATQQEGVKTEQQKEATKTEAAQTQTAQATQQEGVKTEQQKEAAKTEAAQTQTAQATQQEGVKTEQQKEATKTEAAQTQTAQTTQQEGVKTEQQKETAKTETAQTQTAQATQQERVQTEQQKEAAKTEAAQTQTAQATKKEGVKTEQQKETTKTEAAQTQTAQAAQHEAIKSEQPKETAGLECNCAKFAGKDLNDPSIYNPFIAECGNLQREGLIFKVQIGAYRHPENFNYDNVWNLAKAEIIPYEDGITRFTMREFTNLKDAEAFRQIVISKGVKDAWITAVYKGKRILLDDLIKMNFFRNGSL